jgi:hypothetical protein
MFWILTFLARCNASLNFYEKLLFWLISYVHSQAQEKAKVHLGVLRNRGQTQMVRRPYSTHVLMTSLEFCLSLDSNELCSS